MKPRLWRVLLLAGLWVGLAGCALPNTRLASPRAPMVVHGHAPARIVERSFHPTTVAAFFGPLSHHGSWRSDRGHWVWRASDPNFAPFVAGTWRETEHGPTWVSHTPFGWAVEHYGFWRHSSRGWEWRPDTRWSPARVTWRHGPDAIGWAPEIDPLAAREVPPERLWRFADRHIVAACLAGLTPSVSLHDLRHNPWFLTHTRPLGPANGPPRVAGRRPHWTPVAELAPEHTRWHPGIAHQRVAGMVQGDEGPRAERDPADRRDRAQPDAHQRQRRNRRP